MRVSFVIQDLFHLGAQYVTALIVRGFVDKGCQVDLVVSAVHREMLQGGEKSFPVPDTVQWICLPGRRARENIRALRNYLRQTDAVAVVAMDPNYTMALSLAAVGLCHRPRLYMVEHGGAVGIQYDGRTVRETPSGFSWQRLFSWFIYRRYAGLMTVSSGTADDMARMLRYPREKIAVVYNPVIDGLYYEKIKAETTHPWLRNKTCATLVAAGAHTGLKGHLMLFEAVKRAQRYRKTRLVLFGCGNLTETYRRWIADNRCEDVIALGGFTQNLPAEMKAADGFVCSSTVESFSVVLVEAMACDIPLVSTDCRYGPPEILQGGRYGTLVPVGDAEAMAVALGNLPPKPSLMGGDCPWERFTLEATVARYEKAMGLR